MTWDAKSFAGPRAFARHMLKDGRLQLCPLLDEITTFQRGAIEAVLFREGCWQVELVSVMPGFTAEKHRHLRCSSADLILNGGVDGFTGKRSSLRRSDSLLANLFTIGRGEWHGGTADPKGLCYLSFQQWDGLPTFVSEDWQAWT